MEARSGLMRSRASRSDYYRPFPVVLIAGVDRTSTVIKRTLEIENLLNEQPDVAHMTVYGFTPSPGQTIIVGSGASSNRVFAGTVQRAIQKSVRANAKTIYELECIDWTWTLNKRRVFKQYAAGSLPSTAIGDLIVTYAPSFSTARVKTSAPAFTGDVSFTGDLLFDAIQQIVQLCPGWHAYPDYNQVLHFFDTESGISLPADLATGNYYYDVLDYALDISQVQTRMYGIGGGGQTTSAVAIGASSIPVNECGWYSASGGKVRSGSNIITYTGVSASSGAGSITGVTGVSYAIKLGDTCNVFVQVDDAAAQAALAALIGGGDDGIREGKVEDDRWSLNTTTAQATAALSAFNNQDVRGSYYTYDKQTQAGKPVNINLAGRGITATVTLQRVVRRLVAKDKWGFACDFSVVWGDLVDLLSRVVSN